MKIKLASIFLVITALFGLIQPATTFAMPLPDQTPSIKSIFIYRNVLQPNDFFTLVMEDTPYTSTSNLSGYSQTYLWTFTTANGTNLGQTTGCNFNNNGYGFNVIGFYFDNTTAPAWGGTYQLQLKGNPLFFSDPPVYTFDVPLSAYTAFTDNVTQAVSNQVLNYAATLFDAWQLSSTYSLTGTNGFLSTYGESFFNQAVAGMQGLAPFAYSVVISAVSAGDRSWSNTYVNALNNMYTGTYLAPAIASGESFFHVNYNLLGLLLSLAVFVVIIAANWYVGGGDFMRGLIECAAPFVILTRLDMIDFSTGAFVIALAWIYLSARLWRIV